ncbi:Caskin-1 [Galemys pyrenaicus]|uniref:Caskin-1 n=1 Tax=Galemys pyrenaicus TaxID=202257 RepID=A0A8J5ZKK0_GALPY|nr:Caskin-1 [Galemys pyrenaicus]
MGKEQELVQAVKAEDVGTAQRLLQRPRPGKASECWGAGAGGAGGSSGASRGCARTGPLLLRAPAGGAAESPGAGRGQQHPALRPAPPARL